MAKEALQQKKTWHAVLIEYVITFSCIKQLMLNNQYDIQQIHPMGIKYKHINTTAVVDIYILTKL